MTAIEVHVNGELRELPGGTTVADLVEEIAPGVEAVAVERNRLIVPKAEHGVTRLEAGDQVEVVTLVGGG